jgi:hypothetical protein
MLPPKTPSRSTDRRIDGGCATQTGRPIPQGWRHAIPQGIACCRLARRIGKLRALVAFARSILVIVWHLLADPPSRYRDLGPEFFDNRIRPERRTINHISQLEALGFTVTLPPAA